MNFTATDLSVVSYIIVTVILVMVIRTHIRIG